MYDNWWKDTNRGTSMTGDLRSRGEEGIYCNVLSIRNKSSSVFATTEELSFTKQGGSKVKPCSHSASC
jgi:hypothetical protein